MANSIWGGRRGSLKNFYYVVQRVSDQNNWLVEGQKNVPPPHTHTATVQRLDAHQAELIFVIF